MHRANLKITPEAGRFRIDADDARGDRADGGAALIENSRSMLLDARSAEGQQQARRIGPLDIQLRMYIFRVEDKHASLQMG